MTAGASAHQERADLFVADFSPQLGEYLAEQYTSGYDAGAGRARFLAWLGRHADDGEEADAVADPGADADPVQDYLAQVSKLPSLRAEQEIELAKRIEAGRHAEGKLADGGRVLSVDARIGLEWIAA